MLKIERGPIDRAQKVVIYGPEGIGKSTIASKFPDPLFIDTEGGTAHMDVKRTEKPTTWKSLLSMVEEVSKDVNICGTLIIDTADWAEQLTINFLCSKYKKSGIEEFGYGKGYTYLSEEFGRLLSLLDKVIAAGIHVVITAHAKMRKFEQPDEMGAYDRWEMKLSKQVAPLLKEWCDILLFCNYKTYVVQSDSAMEKAKVHGGKRVMYTTHHPCWDAKNRHGLPDELPLDYGKISHLFINPEQKREEALMKLLEKMKAENIKAEDLQKVVIGRGHYPEGTTIADYSERFINTWVFKWWDSIKEAIDLNNGKGGKKNG